jgi:hypothetical protein
MSRGKPSYGGIRYLKPFETLSIYRFSMDYPPVCWIEFNPKGRRERGDVVFHFPDHEKVFLTWGNLEDAKFSNAYDHAEHSLKIMKGSRQVKEFERVKHDSLRINSHQAPYNRVKISQPSPRLFSGRKTMKRETLSLHLHCDRLSRYFVVYAMLSPSAPEDFETLFLDMVRSFKCH